VEFIATQPERVFEIGMLSISKKKIMQKACSGPGLPLRNSDL